MATINNTNTNELPLEVRQDIQKQIDEARKQVESLTQQVAQRVSQRDNTALMSGNTSNLVVPEVNPDDTPAFMTAQEILDTNPMGMLAGLEADRAKRVTNARGERDKLEEERTGFMDELKKFFKDREPQEDMVRKEQKELGITSAMEEQQTTIENIKGLREQAIDLQEQKQEAMAQSDGRIAPVGFIRGEQRTIAEQFDRRISTVAARMQAESAHLQATQGFVNQARAVIGDIVNAATFDTQLELNRISTFIEFNQQEINELDAEIKSGIENSQRFWETKLQLERAEKTQVMEWMVQAAANGVNAGITVGDTLEEAANKMQMAAPKFLALSQRDEKPVQNVFDVETWTDLIVQGQFGLEDVAAEAPGIAQEVVKNVESRMNLLGTEVTNANQLETKLKTAGQTRTTLTLTNREIDILALDAMADGDEAEDIINNINALGDSGVIGNARQARKRAEDIMKEQNAASSTVITNTNNQAESLNTSPLSNFRDALGTEGNVKGSRSQVGNFDDLTNSISNIMNFVR